MSPFEHAHGDEAVTRPISEPTDRVEVSLRVNGEVRVLCGDVAWDYERG